MAEISDMDWAQHIKMDYAQNLRKDPKKAKQTTFRKFKEPIINESNEMYWNPMKSNHEIYTVLWKYVTRFPLLNNLLHIFCVGITKIAQFKLFNKIARFCDDPFISSAKWVCFFLWKNLFICIYLFEEDGTKNLINRDKFMIFNARFGHSLS